MSCYLLRVRSRVETHKPPTLLGPISFFNLSPSTHSGVERQVEPEPQTEPEPEAKPADTVPPTGRLDSQQMNGVMDDRTSESSSDIMVCPDIFFVVHIKNK